MCLSERSTINITALRIQPTSTKNSMYLVGALEVRALARQRHLDGGGAPRDKVHQLALANPLQRLVHLHVQSSQMKHRSVATPLVHGWKNPSRKSYPNSSTSRYSKQAVGEHAKKRRAQLSMQTETTSAEPYLGGVHGALDDVENGDVAALSGVCGHHDVLRLRQSAQQ
jgi:hypothetical protein